MLNDNEQKIKSYYKKESEKRPIKLYNKSLLMNKIDVAELTNNTNSSSSIDRNFGVPVYYTFFNKNRNTDNKRSNYSYNSKIIKDIKFIKKKIYDIKNAKYTKYTKNTAQSIKAFINEKNEIKNKYLTHRGHLVESEKKNQKKIYSFTKNNNHPYILLEYKKKNKYISPNLTINLNDELKENIRYLQKQYYLIDKVDNKKEESICNSNKKKIYSYIDYADRTNIYNHPQLYYINNRIHKHKKIKLPNIEYSINTQCLTESIPNKNEILSKNDLLQLRDFVKMKKTKKPIFFA
jgi:hypothetical protein